MKNGRGVHIFSPIIKKYSYFFPQLNEIYKTAKKKAKIIIYFIWGKNMNPRRGGGQKYEFKI